jgi:hypothetical protein
VVCCVRVCYDIQPEPIGTPPGHRMHEPARCAQYGLWSTHNARARLSRLRLYLSLKICVTAPKTQALHNPPDAITYVLHLLHMDGHASIRRRVRSREFTPTPTLFYRVSTSTRFNDHIAVFVTSKICACTMMGRRLVIVVHEASTSSFRLSRLRRS